MIYTSSHRQYEIDLGFGLKPSVFSPLYNFDVMSVYTDLHSETDLDLHPSS